MTEMKLSIIHLIVMSAVFLRTEEAKYSTITVIPNATVALINDSTFLNCTSTSGAAEWLFAPKQYDDSIIYSYGAVKEHYQSRFRVENYSTIIGSQFNLILLSVREYDAGRYICQNPRNTSEVGREAHLTVLVTEPVCKSDLKVNRLIGPNSCVINPHVSCSVRYIGNQVPELQWKKNGDNITISSSICSESGNVFTCNLTMESELQLEENSYSCVTTQSRTRKYSCTSGVSRTLYVSGDHTELNKTVNDIANCSVNSSQECTTSWNFDNGTASWTESHEQIIKFERPGRFFCEATCESRNMTCSLITMTVNVTPQDDNGLSFGGIIVLAVMVFILISSLIFLFMWIRRRQNQQSSAVGQDPVAIEEVPLNVLDNEGAAVGQDPVAIEEVPLNVLDNEGAAVGQDPVAIEEVPLNVLDNEGTVAEDLAGNNISPTAQDNYKRRVRGLAILRDELFIAFDNSFIIEAVQLNNIQGPHREIKVDGLRAPGTMAACEKNSCLYVVDLRTDSFKRIFRVNSVGTQMSWQTDDNKRGRISVNCEGKIVMTVYDKPELKVYSAEENLVREKTINLSRASITHGFHAINLTDGNFIISHGMYSSNMHQVCKIDTTGEILQSFGSDVGSDNEHLSCPAYLAIRSDGFIFVTDQMNDRIILLNSNLKFEAELFTKNNGGVSRPEAMCIYENCDSPCLVVGCNEDSVGGYVLLLRPSRYQ